MGTMDGANIEIREECGRLAAGRWLWLKIKQEGLRGFWSMFPLTKVPFWYQFFEPLPDI